MGEGRGRTGDTVFDAGYFLVHSFLGDGGEFVKDFIVLQINTCLNH